LFYAIEASQHRVQVVGAGQFRQLCFHFEEALTVAVERSVMVGALGDAACALPAAVDQRRIG